MGVANLEVPFDPGYFYKDELIEFGFKKVGDNVKIAKNCTIIGIPNIALGSNVRIDGNVVIAAGSGFLDVGSYVHIGGGGFLGCAGGITMGDFSGLSQGVRIYSASDDYTGEALTNPTVPSRFLNVFRAPVCIEKHVIIGSGSVVLPGVVVGEGCSIGALSLVKKSLDPWGVCFGVPARRIKSRSKKLLEYEVALRKGNNNGVLSQ